MSIVLRFPRHVRAPTGSTAAKNSKVMYDLPLASAKRTICGHRPGGMPRLRQLLTVERADNPSPSEVALVPPRASMTESGVSDMDRSIVRDLRTCQGSAPCETTILVGRGGLGPMAETTIDIARRLADTREALGFTSQVDFCRAIGIEKNVYNPFEMGSRRISLNVAIKIKKRFGIPLDWIYCGDPAALPLQIYQRLRRSAA